MDVGDVDVGDWSSRLVVRRSHRSMAALESRIVGAAVTASLMNSLPLVSPNRTHGV